MKRTTTHNSTYPKVAVQWLNQALCGETLLAIKSKPLGGAALLAIKSKPLDIYQSLPSVLLRGVLC